jgi:hydrogenase expression/formation protein HypE
MTASFILEEGLPLQTLERIVDSMRAAAEEADIVIVAGDTKVAERGKVDRIFINTTGVGSVPVGREVSGANAKPGDVVLLSGALGEHGIAVLAARGDLGFEAKIKSDVAPLHSLVETMFAASPHINVLRDPTRGGLATALNEIAKQSEVAILLDEKAIPVSAAVEGACEMLGFDPLYVANEGKLVAFVPSAEAEAVLEAIRAHPYGKQACRVGVVEESPSGKVLMRTAIGGTRVVDMLAGEMLPRIC